MIEIRLGSGELVCRFATVLFDLDATLLDLCALGFQIRQCTFDLFALESAFVKFASHLFKLRLGIGKS